jgi:hypothetical protein
MIAPKDEMEFFGIWCFHCKRYLARINEPDIQQPKQFAKKHGWKHGKAKGSWVCPECQKHTPVPPK